MQEGNVGKPVSPTDVEGKRRVGGAVGPESVENWYVQGGGKRVKKQQKTSEDNERVESAGGKILEDKSAQSFDFGI